MKNIERKMIRVRKNVIEEMTFDEVYDKYKSFIVKAAEKFQSGDIEFEELFQIGSVTLLEVFRNYDVTKRKLFQDYLYISIHNRIRNAIRYATNSKRNDNVISLDKIPKEFKDEQASSFCQDIINKTIVNEILSILNDKQKNILILRYLEKMSREEIADELGITKEEVRHSLQYSKEKLKKKYKGVI